MGDWHGREGKDGMHPQTTSLPPGDGIPSLAEAFPGLVFIADAQGMNTFTNARFHDYAARSGEALQGRGWLNVLHPDDRAKADAAWRRAVANGESMEGEFRFRRRDGAYRWHLVCGEPLRNHNGTIIQWVGTCLDIENRKRKERALRQSQALLAHVFYTSPDALAISSVADQRVLDVNDRFLSLFGLTREQAVGQGRLGLALFSDQAESERVLDTLGREGRISDLEIAAIASSGDALMVLLSLEPIEFRGQQLIMLNLRDITERKRMEQTLRREQELLRAIIDRIPVMITLYDPGSGHMRVNAEFERLTGWSTEEATLDSVMTACYPDLDVRQRVAEFMDACPDRWMDVRMRTRDGREIDTTWANVRLSAGTRVGIGLDITQRKRAEQTLRESARRKDQFLAVLAHELRNPLAPLRTGLELLELSDVQDETVVHVREMMQRQLNHVVHLVDDLMDVSRVRRGKIELRKAPLDLRDVVRAAVEQLRPLADERGHRLVVEAPDATLPVAGDPERLTQVLGNLLSNAVKYTDPGGTITLSAGCDGGEAWVRVHDTGVGIPPHRLDQLFEMFSQIPEHQSRAASGLGIGLALARQLVQLHGGTIRVSSAGTGQGSEFVVRLPLRSG